MYLLGFFESNFSCFVHRMHGLEWRSHRKYILNSKYLIFGYKASLDISMGKDSMVSLWQYWHSHTCAEELLQSRNLQFLYHLLRSGKYFGSLNLDEESSYHGHNSLPRPSEQAMIQSDVMGKACPIIFVLRFYETCLHLHSSP